MRISYSIIFLILLCFCCAFADIKQYPNEINLNELVLKEKLYNTGDNVYDIKILNTTYTCYNNNCYNFDSLRYNKLTKSYTIDTLFDLMWCNAHEEYKSPYDDGYISHLIFETKVIDNKVVVHCKGFVVGDIEVDYQKGKASFAHYKINATYKGKPSAIYNIKDFENSYYTLVDTTKIFELLKIR